MSIGLLDLHDSNLQLWHQDTRVQSPGYALLQGSEYLFGDLGDLVAFSAFYKVIDDPIESIILRNPLDRDSGSAALYRLLYTGIAGLHHWTTDRNEVGVLQTRGWIVEGPSYVFPAP